MQAAHHRHRVLRRPTRHGWRVLAGCLIVVLCAAGAAATFVREQVQTLQDALHQTASLNVGSGVLAPSGFGGPETLLLVGNDQRKHTTTAPVLPHSNEMLLVRIDPGRPYISMMSIPRELEVTIYPPGQPAVTTRLNYAYTAGGIPLLVSTIKRVTGLSVNHVVVIDFNQFKRAVDEIGCVYSTVDRRYFHVNTPTSQQYQEINLQPGYQKLCGSQALQFVSYRHGDTSLVRDARDQSFLLSAKQEYGSSLINNIGKFERIFGQTVQTDPALKTANGILSLVGTLINSASLRVRQVHFQANLVPIGATPCACVTATQQQIQASVDSFLYGRAPHLAAAAASAVSSVRSPHGLRRLPLVAVGAAQLQSARAAASRLPFTYEYPRVQYAGGVGMPVEHRDYLIRAPDGSAHATYVDVFPTGLLGQYYDIQGTTWKGAPLFQSPQQSVTLNHRTYELFFSGSHLDVVSWVDRGVAYWIHNSLTDALTNGEMLAIAEQTAPVSGVHALPADVRLRLRAAAVPKRVPAAAGSGEALGRIGGVLTLISVPILAVALVVRRRGLRRLGARLDRTLSDGDRLAAATRRANASRRPDEASPPPGDGYRVYSRSPRRGRRGADMPRV